MHPHLIDWFRNVNIHSDPILVERRWQTAEEYSRALSRSSIPRLLRLFLFPKPETTENAWFTDGLLTLDKEFPVANNAEQLRLMAGVVMVTTFDEGSAEGCAFALGLRAAVFPKRSTLPAQPEILAAAEAYLQAEAERQRPTYFGDAPESRLAEQIRRLAEETGLLWWVISEYSTSLRRRTSGLTAPAYALIAAAEAADRTQILPPPPSADALLARVLKPCKSRPEEGPHPDRFLDRSRCRLAGRAAAEHRCFRGPRFRANYHWARQVRRVRRSGRRSESGAETLPRREH